MSQSSTPPGKPKLRNPILPKQKAPKVRQGIWINSITVHTEIAPPDAVKKPAGGPLKKIFISREIPAEKSEPRFTQQRGVLWN